MRNILTLVFITAVLALALAEKDYTDIVNRLKTDISNTKGIFYHKAYDRLAYLTDTFGTRMWGSSNLESAIQWLASEARNEGFENVHLEPVKNFTKWVRGTETLTLYSPRPTPTNLHLIGLGNSVAGNVLANAIVVRSWDELDAMKDKVKGKIVVYNEPWTTYGETVMYRSRGASRAAAYGAVAALVKSVTPESIESVHAGVMHYDESLPKIPVAAIALEDAEMFQRMQDRNQTITLRLVLENQVVSGCYSNNVIFEIKGSTYPDQILLLGGHIDTWDTGSQTGANDDGGGFLTVFEALRLLNKNGLRPKRTLRFIAWSGEEWGGLENGAQQYARDHANEIPKHVVAFENDLGSTKLVGFGYVGNSGMNIVKEVGSKYLSLLDAGVVNDAGEAADTGPLYAKGVPVMANIVADTPDHSFYFKYHHSQGDSMSMMNPDEMDSNVVGIAAMFYILADLDTTVRNVNNVEIVHNLRAE